MNSGSDKMRVLLVDDESMCHMSISSFAKKLGVEFDGAKDGQEAIEKVKENSYNLILMDMIMPGMDGKQTVEEIRNLTNGQTHTIVAMSADDLSEEELITLGFNGFIKKPINRVKFENLVNTYKP